MADAARTCDRAPTDMRALCYQSLGRDISAYSLQKPSEAIRMCSLGHPDYQPWCYVGLVKNFIDVTSKAESGLNFCPQVPGQANRMKCYEAVGEEIWALRRTTRTARRSAERPKGMQTTPPVCARFEARASRRCPDHTSIIDLSWEML